MKERYERGVTGWEKAIGNLEGEMAKQAKNFKAEREHCYALMARLEEDLRHLQEQNHAATQVLEARSRQTGCLLQEKGIMRERVRIIADYITMKCSACEDMTRSMFFATVMIFVRQIMEEFYRLQDDMASRPAARLVGVPREGLETLMYS